MKIPPSWTPCFSCFLLSLWLRMIKVYGKCPNGLNLNNMGMHWCNLSIRLTIRLQLEPSSVNLLAILVSGGSVTSRTPLRNKYIPTLTCLLRPEHLGRGRTMPEPNHTSTTIGNVEFIDFTGKGTLFLPKK